MQKKELVSLFMESPFYFELTAKERLFLLQDHRRRFGRPGATGLHEAAVAGESPGLVTLPLLGEPQIKRVEN